MAMLPQRMDAFEPYVQSLEALACRALQSLSIEQHREAVTAALNGQAHTELRKLVPLSIRKANGAFFTGVSLAEQALGPDTNALTDGVAIVDPACGAGDLLVACARRLPVFATLQATLFSWGQQLHGFDVHPAFVRVARARLALLAMSRSKIIEGPAVPPFSELFPGLLVRDGLADAPPLDSTCRIVLNPPYRKVPAPDHSVWGFGQVSQAAIFVDHYVNSAQPGTPIVAILPDVLRTGSLYAKWRAAIESRTNIESVQIIGTFDAWADVDVFILRCIVGPPPARRSVSWWKSEDDASGKRVANAFEVHTGAVVPHRHPELGPQYPYVYARLLPPDALYDASQAPLRNFAGRTFIPPFVAVRRTSSPNDRVRAVGTIVTGKGPVAVENHLLVLTPRDQTNARCEELLASLRDRRTKAWLDERIRCRHLTVSSVRDLPIWEGEHAG